MRQRRVCWADKELEQPTCESDVAEETMSAVVKLAKEIDEPYDISQPRKLVTCRDELRPVQGGGEDTGERVITSHTEMCEKSEVISVEEGHDVDGRHAPQSDDIAGILKQSKDEMSADLTAFKKKGLDRKTNRQGLMKAETQPRSARPPPWRDKLRIEGESLDANEKNTDGNKGPDEVFDRGESMLCLASSYFGSQGCNPRRGDEFFCSISTIWNM